MNTIATEIAGNATDSGLFTVSFSAYQNVGTFDMEGIPKADTIQFQRGSVTDSVIEIGAGTPFITIRNWKGVLRLSNLAFRLGSPSAVLIDGSGASTSKPGTLILDSCVIFGGQMSSNVIQWVADTGRRIEIKRSYIVASQGSGSSLTLSAPNISFYNNVLNFSGALQPTVTKNFIFSANTVSRMQINASGPLVLAKYQLANNLIAQSPGQDYLGTESDTGYFIALTNFKDSGSVVKNNEIYNNWLFDYPTDTRFNLDTSNHAITPYLQPDTTELWNWGLTGDTKHGFLAGDSARPNPYNVFPGDTLRVVTLPDNTPATLNFQTSFIPRTLLPAFTGGLSPDSLFPAYRFVWQGKPALSLGGPFRLDSMTLGGLTQDGNPVLLAGAAAGGFAAQSEGVMNPGSTSAKFRNQTPAATAFHAAFRCNTRMGTNVVPTPEMGFTATADSLSFGSVARPGRTLWATTTINGFPADVRYLNRTMSYTTTAMLTAGGQVLIGTHQFAAPFRADSLKLSDATTDSLYPAHDSAGFVSGRIQTSASSFAVYAVEHLSVPRGNTKVLFPFSWGKVQAESDSGFQLQLDTSRSVDTTQFAYVQKPLAVTWQGRGLRDSILISMRVTPDLELWKIPASGTPAFDSATVRNGDSLQVTVATADSDVAFFSGLSLNIPAGTYNGIVNGFEVDGLQSKVALRLTLGALTAANADTVTPVRNMRFLGGVSIAMRHSQLAATYALRFGVAKPMNTDSAQAWVYAPGSGWEKNSAITFSSGLDTVRVSGLDSTTTNILVMEAIGPPVGITPKWTVPSPVVAVEFSNLTSPTGTVNQYRVVMETVDANGNASTQTSALTPVAAVLDIPIDSTSYHAFTVQYYVGVTLAAVSVLGPLPQLQVSNSTQQAEFSPTISHGWQLVALPFDDNLRAHILTTNPSKDTVDTIRTFLLKQTDTNYSWDSSSHSDTLKVRQGESVLFGGTRSYRLQLAASVTPSLLPFTLPDTLGGWKLIGDPFPFAFPIAKLASNKGTLSNLERLNAVAAVPGPGHTYNWISMATTESLLPFTGYAYFFRPGEVLTFDPLAVAATAKSAAAEVSGLRINAQINGGNAAVRVFPAGQDEDVPALPAPGISFDLRLGADPGWWSKGVAWSGFTLPLIVNAPQSGLATFSLSPQGNPLGAAAVWDSLSGIAYAASGSQSVPVVLGENRLTLLGGDGEYVAARIADLQKLVSGPGRFSVSAVAGRMHLDLVLPSQSGGYDQVAVSLHDAQGRRLGLESLGRTAAGETQREWNIPKLRPGIYFCRVRAASGNKIVFSGTQPVAVNP